MSETIAGLHHVTMIAGSPQRNVDFYSGILGLRLVKQTVNFDDPGSYHLYYGDELGRPGTILTFFSWPGAYPGRVGSGQAITVSLAVPRDSISFWQKRLTKRNVKQGEIVTRFDSPVLPFFDKDGLCLELVGIDDAREPWTRSNVPAEHAVRGLYSVTLLESDVEATDRFLTSTLGFTRVDSEEGRTRYKSAGNTPGTLLDITQGDGRPPGRDGIGTVHHIAWRVQDQVVQRAWRDKLLQMKLVVSPVMDRSYFTSIYFREPDGVLFELATEAPGFAVDELPEELGTSLMLPPQYESSRATIERHLPKLRLRALRAADDEESSE